MRYTSAQITTMLTHPAVKSRVSKRVRVNYKYDVPGLAACSKNGRTVYIDRHISPRYYKNVRDYALMKRALIDLFHLSPFFASQFAADATICSGLDRTTNLQPKSATQIKNPPIDLDLSGFRIQNARIIKRRINRKKALDKAKELAYTDTKGVRNVDRNLYQEWVSSLSKN